MPTGQKGSIHLFRLAGVDLYLHWSWFLVAFYEIQGRGGRYSSILWSVLEYLALFLIVLMHEFGHAMACRSAGGTANQILLWPFGGVAYVRPPQRPGAMLWSIAAGPLVNVALLPVLYALLMFARASGWPDTMPDVFALIYWVSWINAGLLVFNLLPIYPLDGGQILRSLLWFAMGRGRSLMVATVVGFFGIAALVAYAAYSQSIWTAAICVFLGINCWSSWKRSRLMLQMAKLPRREGFRCPSCRTAPLLGAYWSCDQCQQGFDIFATEGICPYCRHEHADTICIDCQETSPTSEWVERTYAGAAVVSASFEAK
jgi:Zn-dependent protease